MGADPQTIPPGGVDMPSRYVASEHREAQSFLERYGYVKTSSPRAAPTEQATRKAIARYQTRHGLPVTGSLDAVTQDAIAAPRCGLPDLRNGLAFTTACAWDRMALSFAFQNTTLDIPGTAEYDAVRRAFTTWAAAKPFRFAEVAPGANPDILIEWRNANDPDLDMRGSALAHADFPPKCGVLTKTLPRPLHFDDSEHRWWVFAAPNTVDLESVTLHEIGHILGLQHSSVRLAVMFDSFLEGSTRRRLHQDDLDGLEALYPTPRPTPPPTPPPPNLPVWERMTSYLTPAAPAARVVFRDANGHVHEMNLTPTRGTWARADLTVISGAPTSDHGTAPPVGYFTPSPLYDAARVVYADTTNHIHEMYLTSGQTSWKHADLTAITGAPPDRPRYLSAYFTPAPLLDAARVVYSTNGPDGIHELYLTPGQRAWNYANLTAITGAPKTQGGGGPSAYFTPASLQNAARVVYRSYDYGVVNHLFELYYMAELGVWKYADLTTITGSPQAAGAPFGYFTPAPLYDAARVVYRGFDGHVYELYMTPSSNGWKYADLTAITGAPPASQYGEPFGYSTRAPLGDAARVVYATDDKRIIELYFTVDGAH